jgi:hypothetical protein
MQQMKNKLLSLKEYEKMFKKLNKPTHTTRYLKTGALMLRCDGKLIETHKELDDYQKREKAGERFYFNMEFIPAKNLSIIKNAQWFHHVLPKRSM